MGRDFRPNPTASDAPGPLLTTPGPPAATHVGSDVAFAEEPL
jgi:hypothetical protein